MPGSLPPVRVNRAPVLTLWAAVVAERLGHPPDTALSLASAVASTAAKAKARRLGLAEERDHADRSTSEGHATARLLGKEVRLSHDANGVVLADTGDGKPAPAAPIAVYLSKAFGSYLGEVRGAMEALAGQFAPEELNRVGFRLYEQFRPEVPPDVRGWGAKRWNAGAPMEDANFNRRQAIHVGASVVYTQVWMIGFDAPIDLQSLRLYKLPEAPPAVLNGTPLLTEALFGSGRRELEPVVDILWHLASEHECCRRRTVILLSLQHAWTAFVCRA